MADLAAHFVVPIERAFDARYGLEHVAPGHGRLTVRPELLGADGTVSAGVYMAMAETVASAATAAEVVPRGLMASGLSNATYVVGDARDGVLEARATCRARGAGEWLWDVEIGPPDGAATALAAVVIAVREKRV